MASFCLFLKLPPEVRTSIWAYSIENRTVDIRALQASRHQHRGAHRHSPEEPDPFTPVSVPAVMQVCRESRSLQLYEKYEYSYPAEPRCDMCTFWMGVVNIAPAQPEQRYAWINFEMDMIDMGRDHLYDIKHIALRIQRLMLERDNTEEYWYHDEGHELIHFRNLEVIHVLSPHTLALWCDAWTERYWSCEKENLKFIDKETGQVAGVDEVYVMLPLNSQPCKEGEGN